MGHYGDLAGRARLSVLLAAAASLLVALVLLSGPQVGGAQEQAFSEPSDALNSVAGDDELPEASERTARIGSGGSSSGRDSEGLRDWVEGTADARLREKFLSYTAGRAEDLGKSIYGLNFQLQSRLTWGKNDSIKGSVRAVVPLGGRGGKSGGRWAYFLQPSINIWDDDLDERRTDLGLGLVGRLRTGTDSSLGLGGFIERGRYGHERASLGTEWRHRRSSVGVNAYLPISKERAGVNGRREQVVSGYDIQLKQGFGDRLVFSASANRWNSKTSESLSSGGSAEISYALTPSIRVLSGYTWSDKSLTERDSYNAGFEFRLPADKISGFQAGARNLYEPFARNERITTQITSLAAPDPATNLRQTLAFTARGTETAEPTKSQIEQFPQRSGSNPQPPRPQPITVGLTEPLDRDVCLEMDFKGTTTQGEDYRVDRRFVLLPKGAKEHTFTPFSLLDDGNNQNEPEESLTIDFILSDLSDCQGDGGQTVAYYVLDIPDEEEIERNKRLGLKERVFSIKLRFAARGNPVTADRSALRLALAVTPTSGVNETTNSTVTATITVQKKNSSGVYINAVADDISARNLPDGLPYRLVLLNRSATYGEDFTAEKGEAEGEVGGAVKGIFGKGENALSATHEVEITEDDKTEGAENFVIQLVSLADEADVNTADGVSVAIDDTSKDPAIATPPTRVTLSVSPSSGNEAGELGNPATQFTVTATLTAPTGATSTPQVDIPLVFRGRLQTPGASLADLDSPPTVVSVAADSSLTSSSLGPQTAGTATVAIKDDTDYENLERFIVSLGEMPEGYVAGAVDGSGTQAFFSIGENDVPAIASGHLRVKAFSAPSSLTEASGGRSANLSITVERSSQDTAQRDYDFPLTFTDGTAQASEEGKEDYETPEKVTVSFAQNQAEKTTTFGITAKDDDLAEGAQRENFSFRLGNPADAESVTWLESAGSRTRFVSIVDDDELILSVADVAVNEGGAAEFTVTSAGNKTSEYAIEGQVFADKSLDGRLSGWESENDALQASRFILAAGETEAKFTIATTDDNKVNGGATIDDTTTISVKFDDLRGLLADGSGSLSANLKVTDNDEATLSFRDLPALLKEDPNPVENGASRLVLSHSLEAPVNVQVRKVDTAAGSFTVALGATKQAVTGSFATAYTIPKGVTEVPIFITPINDNASTGNQNLKLEVQFQSGTATWLVGENPQVAASEAVVFEDDEASFSFDHAGLAEVDEGREVPVRVVLEKAGAPAQLKEEAKLVLQWRKGTSGNWSNFTPAAEKTDFSTSASEHTFRVSIPGDETLNTATYPVQFQLLVTKASDGTSRISNLTKTDFTSSAVQVTNTEGAQVSWKTASPQAGVEAASLPSEVQIRLVNPDSSVANVAPKRSQPITLPIALAAVTSNRETRDYSTQPSAVVFAADTSSTPADEVTVSYVYDDDLITRDATTSDFTLTLGAPTANQYGDGRVAVVGAPLTHRWSNDTTDKATPVIRAAATPDPIIEPGGNSNPPQPADDLGSLVFSLEIPSGKELGESYRFGLSAAVAPSTLSLKALTVDGNTGDSVTFPVGTDAGDDEATIRTGFVGTSSDGEGTRVTLSISATGANEGIVLSANPLTSDYAVSDADKARPVLSGVQGAIAENGALSDFSLRLSRDTATATAATVELVAILLDETGTEQARGAAKTITFAQADDATTAKTITGSNLPVLPTGFDDAFLNGARKLRILATLKTGATSEVELNSTDSADISITDDETGVVTLAFSNANVAEAVSSTNVAGATRNLTITLTPAASVATRFFLRHNGGSVIGADFNLVATTTGATYTRNAPTSADGMVAIPAKAASVVMTFTAKDDTLVEGDEDITLKLSQAGVGEGGGAARYSETPSAKITIGDVDDDSLALSGDAWPTAIAEGGTEDLDFTLTIPADHSLAKAVAFDIAGTGIHKTSDDSKLSGLAPIFKDGSTAVTELTFPVSTAKANPTKTLTLEVPDDDVAALYDVRFQINKKAANDDALSAATSLTAPVNAAAEINITNNDTVALSFEGVPASVAEGAVANTATRLKLSHAAAEDLLVTMKLEGESADKFVVSTSGGIQTAGNNPQTQLLTTGRDFVIPAGTKEVAIEISATDDSVVTSPLPNVKILANFKNTGNSAVSAGYVASNAVLESSVVGWVEDEKSLTISHIGGVAVAAGAEVALKEGVATPITVKINGTGNLAGTKDAVTTVTFRPEGVGENENSKFIRLGAFQLTRGASSWSRGVHYDSNANPIAGGAKPFMITVPGDGILNQAARKGTLQVGLEGNDGTFAGLDTTQSNPVVVYPAAKAAVANGDRALIVWEGSNSDAPTRQIELGREGESLSPKARLVLVSAGDSVPSDWSAGPILEDYLELDITLTPVAVGGSYAEVG